MSRKLLIGCAAGFGGDRTDAALPIVETLIAQGEPGVLVFEVLAERTLALAQLERQAEPNMGYAPLLDPMLRPVLQRAVDYSIPIVSNFGAANPWAAAARIHELARELGINRLRIAVVEGDDLSAPDGRALLKRYIGNQNDDENLVSDETLVSANVYLGAEPIAAALRAGAQVVVTGRVADPSLFVGPAMAHFHWAGDDWHRLAAATMAGHLLECGAQVTGGYFADPPFKQVPDLPNVGFPIAVMDANGVATITKADGTGGAVTQQTVKEQLLYEVHDPRAYLTPDVTADISQAEVTETGPNRVELKGVTGHPRPEMLKATVCYLGGWLGEGEISYCGPNAEARARLAADIIRQRVGDQLTVRFDLIGVISSFGDDHNLAQSRCTSSASSDVRLRVAGAHRDCAHVERLIREVTALYTCGPAGGGGVRTSKRQRLHSMSCYLPRQLVPASFRFLEQS